MVVLQLRDGAPDVVLPALERLIQQSPAFLRDSPVVLGLDDLKAEARQPDFAGLVDGLRALRLVPVGTSGGSGLLRQAAAAAGLAQLSKGQQLFRSKGQAPAEPSPEMSPPVETVPPPAEAPEPPPAVLPAAESEPPADAVPMPTEAGQTALVITQPLRAGARVYAKGRDVVCIATVNPGAEIIADGHVHVYGALRGRAIAGAAGFEEARIFALNFDPELVAIAGLYRVRDDLDPAMIGQRLQVSLAGDEMRLTPFG